MISLTMARLAQTRSFEAQHVLSLTEINLVSDLFGMFFLCLIFLWKCTQCVCVQVQVHTSHVTFFFF